MFAVDLEGAESGLYATLYGRFDSVEAYKFEAVVNAVTKDTKGIVLDFTNLEYISSVGLRKILQKSPRPDNSAAVYPTGLP